MMNIRLLSNLVCNIFRYISNCHISAIQIQLLPDQFYEMTTSILNGDFYVFIRIFCGFLSILIRFAPINRMPAQSDAYFNGRNGFAIQWASHTLKLYTKM